MGCSMPGLPVPHHPLKFVQVHVHCFCDAIQPSHPLPLPCYFRPQSFPLSGTVPMRWPKFWSFSSSPFNEYSGLISFRIDWFYLAIQGTLKSLLQHHNFKTSVLRCSAFFMIQISHLYMTTGKTIALTRQTFVGKLMSLLFNVLSLS